MDIEAVKSEIRDLQKQLRVKQAELRVAIGKSYRERVLETFEPGVVLGTKELMDKTLIPDKQLAKILHDLVMDELIAHVNRGHYMMT